MPGGKLSHNLTAICQISLVISVSNRRLSDLHGRSGNFHDVITGIAPSAADTRALIGDTSPARFRSHVAEPERKGPALVGAQRINGASPVVKQAVSPAVLLDAVTVFVGIKVSVAKGVHRCRQMRCDRSDLIPADVNGAGFAGAALTATKAFEG